MKRIFLTSFATFLFAASVSAQITGNLPGYDNTGLGGSTGNIGSSSSSSSGASSGGSNVGVVETTGVSAASDVDRFEGVGSMDFVGIRDGVPFIGRERPFESSSSRSSNVLSSTSRSSRTTSRTSASRTSIGSRTSSTSNQSGVRAATTTDFSFSPMEVGHREAAFRTRMQRMPNLRVIPDQVRIQVARSGADNVATVRGTVASERDRKLVRQLLLLEPGIDRVDNQLVVVKEATEIKDLDAAP